MKVFLIFVAVASFFILLDFVFILEPEKILPLSEFRGFWIIFALVSTSALAISLPKVSHLLSRETSYYGDEADCREVEFE